MAIPTDVTPQLGEEAPLLGVPVNDPHDAVYDRFSKQRKRTILAFVSWGGLVPRESFSFTSEVQEHVLIWLHGSLRFGVVHPGHIPDSP
jgi:hypothetical protein